VKRKEIKSSLKLSTFMKERMRRKGVDSFPEISV